RCQWQGADAPPASCHPDTVPYSCFPQQSPDISPKHWCSDSWKSSGPAAGKIPSTEEPLPGQPHRPPSGCCYSCQRWSVSLGYRLPYTSQSTGGERSAEQGITCP